MKDIEIKKNGKELFDDNITKSDIKYLHQFDVIKDICECNFCNHYRENEDNINNCNCDICKRIQ